MAATTTTQNKSIWDNIGEWVGGVSKVFDLGTNAYAGIKQRLAALDGINDDTVKVSEPKTQQSPAAIPTITKKQPDWLIPAIAVGLVIVGIFVAKQMR